MKRVFRLIGRKTTHGMRPASVCSPNPCKFIIHRIVELRGHVSFGFAPRQAVVLLRNFMNVSIHGYNFVL